MYQVLLAIRHHGCPISDTTAQYPDVTVQSLSKGRVADGLNKRLLSVRGSSDDIEAFAASFREHDLVDRLDRVSEETEDLVYYTAEIAYDQNLPSILDILYNFGFFHHTVVSMKNGVEHWKVFGEEKGVVHKLLANIEELGNEIVLYRSRELGTLGTGDSLELNTMLTELTPRQRTAFETALELGYYEQGSDVTTAQIAEEIGIHQSTLWEHLQKAENILLSNIGRELFPLTSESRANDVSGQAVGSLE